MLKIQKRIDLRKITLYGSLGLLAGFLGSFTLLHQLGLQDNHDSSASLNSPAYPKDTMNDTKQQTTNPGTTDGRTLSATDSRAPFTPAALPVTYQTQTTPRNSSPTSASQPVASPTPIEVTPAPDPAPAQPPTLIDHLPILPVLEEPDECVCETIDVL